MSENPTSTTDDFPVDGLPESGAPAASAAPAAPVRPKATHPLALAPVGSPASSVDGFVREFLRELNYCQGVAL